MSAAVIDAVPDRLTIIYDGECPFCGAYAKLYAIRANAGDIEMINARDDPALVTELRSKGMEINDGMVVMWRGETYWGAYAMHILSVLGAESGFFGMANRLLFGRRTVARFTYPILTGFRRLTLATLGRKMIS
ncbi:MAG TPA: DCC1-like thiol-disulfide oxidoreductase family protein [Burkholderiales bacterium]|nr:DCC1-like thiol-disulfide oxidoreductase family protein [Burkholderiales bacterium]